MKLLAALAEKYFVSLDRHSLYWGAAGLGILWGVLLNHLAVFWSVNPQYGYGWAVPGLCLYLAWLAGKKGVAMTGLNFLDH